MSRRKIHYRAEGARLPHCGRMARGTTLRDPVVTREVAEVTCATCRDHLALQGRLRPEAGR